MFRTYNTHIPTDVCNYVFISVDLLVCLQFCVAGDCYRLLERYNKLTARAGFSLKNMF